MEVVVFTNGCFDILHQGHIELLQKARRLGTKLIVGINSDRSVRAIKGSPRPFLNETVRAAILKELRSVDEVKIFDENTPERLIMELKPDVLVKGGDWVPEQIVGADFVLKNGGKVLSIPFESDSSSSKIVDKIINSELNQISPVEITNSKSELILNSIGEITSNLRNQLLDNSQNIIRCAELIEQIIKNGRKILFLTEDENFSLVKNFTDDFIAHYKNKEYFRASDLHKDENLISFEKQIQSGDLFLNITFKDDDSKLIQAMMQARNKDCRSIVITGEKGKKLASVSDYSIVFNSRNENQLNMLIFIVLSIWGGLIKVTGEEN